MTLPIPGSRRDKTRKWWVGVGIAIVLLSCLGNLVQGYNANVSQNDHHASTDRAQKIQAKKDNYEIKLLKEVVSLTTEVKAAQADHAQTLNEVHALAVDIDELVALEPSVKSALTAGQNDLLGKLAAICQSTGANCP